MVALPFVTFATITIRNMLNLTLFPLIIALLSGGGGFPCPNVFVLYQGNMLHIIISSCSAGRPFDQQPDPIPVLMTSMDRLSGGC